jgi:amino acid permease
MGAGILAIPVTMSSLGLVLGTVFIVAISLTTAYSVKLLTKCKDMTGR